MQKTEILFIINPISGTVKKKNIQGLLKSNETLESWNWKIEYTQRAGHATEIAQKAVAVGVLIVVAVGGDGTVNETAQALIGTKTKLGIIPLGSGNGLARHLKIPLNTIKAIHTIAKGNSQLMDTCLVNQQPFFCTSGVGFDALVSHKFAQGSGRGLPNYIKAIIKSYFGFQPTSYQISVDGKEHEETAYSITLANANQYGNDAFISPQADITDGLLDVCIIKKHPFWQLPMIAIRLMTGNIYGSRYFQLYRGKQIGIKGNASGILHFDGEPLTLSGNLDFRIEQKNLRVIVL